MDYEAWSEGEELQGVHCLCEEMLGVPCPQTLIIAVTQLVPVVQRPLKGCMRGCRLVHGHLRYGLRQRSRCAVPLFMLITHPHGSGAGSAGVTARRQRLAAKQR